MSYPYSCVCGTYPLWCWGCGHDEQGCNRSCLRGLHGWCDPSRNAEQRRTQNEDHERQMTMAAVAWATATDGRRDRPSREM